MYCDFETPGRGKLPLCSNPARWIRDMVEAAAYSHPGGRGWTSPKAADATDTKPEEDLAEQEL